MRWTRRARHAHDPPIGGSLLRARIPALLLIFIAVFYLAVGGVAIGPYYSAAADLFHTATGTRLSPRAVAPSPPPRLVQHTSASPIPTGTSASPIPARTPATSRRPTATGRALSIPTRATGRVPSTPHGTILSRRQRVAEVQRLITSQKLPHKRVNLLILGSDNDAKVGPGASPDTQVMIVLSVDTVSHTITLLSIPRDFWVHIPGYRYNTAPDGSGTVGWSKIDVASELGFDAAACTVERNFGIPIDEWVWVGLKGFTKVIDTLNGVTIEVTHPVVDDTYPDDLTGNAYAYRRIYLPPGPQHLTGSDALHFVRSRHGDIQGDFGRSQRQQILLTQIRRMVDQSGGDLITLAPSLLRDFHGELQTDASVDLGTAAYYYSLLRSVAHTKIAQVVLQPPLYSTPGVPEYDADPRHNTGGAPEDTVAPSWPAISAEIQRIFGGQSFSAPHCARVVGATTP